MDFTINLNSYIPTSLVLLSSISGNPHLLDIGSSSGNLYIKLLSFYNDLEIPEDAISRINFFNDLGIAIDDVSNFVITYKLISESKFINEFAYNNEILNLNLSNLNNIKNLTTKEKEVYVFENPSLISLKKINKPIIISYGIPNYCVYKIIDLLIKSGNTIYYNGDYDPEGLLIANNLVKRFSSIKLFCYEKEDYYNSISMESINSNRLKKLDNIDNKELLCIKKCLKEHKLSGYQEKNINNIKNFMSKK